MIHIQGRLQVKLYLLELQTRVKSVLLLAGKGRFHPRTDHEGLKGEKRYSSTLSLTSALDGGRLVKATPLPLYPE
jgi:hypothetical protein